MKNSGYAFCTGYRCPLLEQCMRYDFAAFDHFGELMWTSSQYDAESGRCPMYDPMQPSEREILSYRKR